MRPSRKVTSVHRSSPAMMILERIHRPEKRIRAAHRGHAFVRMPHAVGVAVVEKPLVELAPVVVPAEIAEPRHQLEPRDREHDVVVGGVAVRQHVAEHEVRLRDDFLPQSCIASWRGSGCDEVVVEQLHRVVVLGAEERHVREHEQRIDRRRRGFGGKHVLIADANERLLRER